MFCIYFQNVFALKQMMWMCFSAVHFYIETLTSNKTDGHSRQHSLKVLSLKILDIFWPIGWALNKPNKHRLSHQILKTNRISTNMRNYWTRISTLMYRHFFAEFSSARKKLFGDKHETFYCLLIINWDFLLFIYFFAKLIANISLFEILFMIYCHFNE